MATVWIFTFARGSTRAACKRSPPQMLDKTYGHLLPDALDRGRAALDLFVNNAAEAAEL